MKSKILKDTFSIENVSFSQYKRKQKEFISLKEKEGYCVVTASKKGKYKCLQINTHYSPEVFGILKKVSKMFSQGNISIFAFTSIDFGYFFFEEKLQHLVEIHILENVKNIGK